MICKNCGKEIHDGNKFCPFCGEKVVIEGNTKIEAPSTHVLDEATETLESLEMTETKERSDRIDTGLVTEKKSSVKKVAIIGVAVALIVAICAGGILLSRNHESIDVYLIEIMQEPEFDGFDGEGFLAKDIAVDKEKLHSILSTIEDEERAANVKAFLLSVKYQSNKSENLNDGEEIEITAIYDKSIAEDLYLTIVNESTTLEVDLEPAPPEPVQQYEGIVVGESAYVTDGNIIHKVDLKTSETEELIQGEYIDSIALFDDKLYYMSHGNGITSNNKIYTYDLNTQKTTELVSNACSYRFELLDDGTVCYETAVNIDDPDTPIILIKLYPDGSYSEGFGDLTSEYGDIEGEGFDDNGRRAECNTEGYYVYTEVVPDGGREIYLETPTDVIFVTCSYYL